MSTVFAALRPLRTELVGVAGLTALLLLSVGVVAARLLAFDLPVVCLDPESANPICGGRQYDAFAYQAFAEGWTGPLRVGAALLPALAGIVLGLSTVAKELDQRTAVLAWSVGPSRRRWMLQRVVPLVVVVFVLGIGCERLIAALMQLRNPGAALIPDQQFEALAYTGFGPAASGISAFGVTVVVGAMLGRLLPSLLAAGAFVLFASLLIQQGNDQLMVGESLIAEQMLAGAGREVDSVLRTPDGRIMSWNEAFPEFVDPDTGALRPGVTQMVRYVPIEIYPQVAARYVLFHLLVGLSALTLAFMVVERRSP